MNSFMRIKLLLSILCLCSAAWASTTTLTGSIADAQGNPLNGTLVMQLPTMAQDITTNTQVTVSPVYFRVVNGAITGGAPLYDVANLRPTGLYYITAVYDSAGRNVFNGNFYVTGTTFNLGAATPTNITTSNVSFANPVFTGLTVNGSATITNALTANGTTTLGNGNSFSPVTFSNHNNVFWAGPGATPTIDQAVTQCTSLAVPCIVEISPGYTGPEAASLVTTSLGYKIYPAANNVTIIDHRQVDLGAGNPTGTNLYGEMFGGRLAGQLVRLGVNYYSHSASDSAAGASSFIWLDGTLPSNGGQQAGNICGFIAHDTLTIGTAVPSLTCNDAESYWDVTTPDKDVPYLSAYTGQTGMNRANATGNMGVAVVYAANGCPNTSSTGKIRDCLQIDISRTTTGTSRNYGMRSQEPILLENVGGDPSLDFSEASQAISSLSESGTTVTVTTTATCPFPTGSTVYISNVGGTSPPPASQLGYMGTWVVLTPGCNGGSTFTYTNTASGLATISSNAGRVQGVHKGMLFNSGNTSVDLYPYLDSVGWNFLTNLNSASRAVVAHINNVGILAVGTLGCDTDGGCFLGSSSKSILGEYMLETSAPSGSAGKTVLGANSTSHMLQASYNAGSVGNIPLAQCFTSQKTESAADAALLTCTPLAVAGTYRLRFSMAVSAQNTATLGWTATWKDSNGQSQAPTNLSLFTSGTAAPALTVTAATNGVYYGDATIDIDASATNIVVKLTFTGTSFTAKVSAVVERLL